MEIEYYIDEMNNLYAVMTTGEVFKSGKLLSSLPDGVRKLTLQELIDLKNSREENRRHEISKMAQEKIKFESHYATGI